MLLERAPSVNTWRCDRQKGSVKRVCMKKMQVADEKKSARTINPGRMRSLV
jgi:hypothetical protein